ncbi:MAG: DEAD/DEAH box helicase [Bacteroidota bacterium]
MRKSGFERYELHERILEKLPELGFRRPTQVQEKVIPLFIQKKNMIVEAPTGTGKTAAYGLPLISRLNLLKRSTQALVMVPSRELAVQVTAALRSYFNGDQLKVGAVYGGSTMQESFDAIKSAPHILVIVPGRLKDVSSQQKYDFLWRDIKFLIIDEGDKLLEMGFQKDFDAIRQHIRNRVQVGFFSATISEDSEALMRERYGRTMTLRLHPKDILKNLRFHLVKAKKGQREAMLAGLIQQEALSQALIFCGKRADIYGITGFLRNLGYKAEAYYGDQEQNERNNILQRFREGHIQFLVATDLAARGLDIPELPAVINLAIPQEYDYYLHRVGRTGRAGRRGHIYNIVLSEAEGHYVRNHHRLIELPLKNLKVEMADVAAEKVKEVDKWTKFLISRGKRDKVRKGDIVGFLTNTSALTGDEIGTITIYDSYTIVDMPIKGFEELAAKGDQLRLKGKTVKVRRYQIEEMEQKAKAVKKLKKDRRGERSK